MITYNNKYKDIMPQKQLDNPFDNVSTTMCMFAIAFYWDELDIEYLEQKGL